MKNSELAVTKKEQLPAMLSKIDMAVEAAETIAEIAAVEDQVNRIKLIVTAMADSEAEISEIGKKQVKVERKLGQFLLASNINYYNQTRKLKDAVHKNFADNFIKRCKRFATLDEYTFNAAFEAIEKGAPEINIVKGAVSPQLVDMFVKASNKKQKENDAKIKEAKKEKVSKAEEAVWEELPNDGTVKSYVATEDELEEINQEVVIEYEQPEKPSRSITSKIPTTPLETLRLIQKAAKVAGSMAELNKFMSNLEKQLS